MIINDLIKDWGGFEEFVKDIHLSNEVSTQRNVVMTGQSGVKRQIDVLLKHKKGPYDYITIIECKFWKKKVERYMQNLKGSIYSLLET